MVPGFSQVEENDSNLVVETRSPIVSAVAWPFENVVQPFFDILMFPLLPPIRYVNREGVIDKGLNLITYGERDNIFLYPVMVIQSGSSGLIGLKYIQNNTAADRKDRLTLGGYLFLNADYSWFSSYTLKNVLNSDVSLGMVLKGEADSDASSYLPDRDRQFLYADTNLHLQAILSKPLVNGWNFSFRLHVSQYRFSQPLGVQDSILPWRQQISGFGAAGDRGMYQSFWQFPMYFIFGRDGRNYPYAPTTGSYQEFMLIRVPVSNYSGGGAPDDVNDLDHDFSIVRFMTQHAFLLGERRYKLDRKEINENKKFFQDFSVNKTMELFQRKRIRETLLERKVVLLQFRFQQMWEDNHQAAPFHALQGLGYSTPLRGYSADRFRDYSFYALSAEYRWPIINYVDGLAFNEYGIYQRSVLRPDFTTLKNSWGFGIRVRTPTFFIFRTQLGFHGAQGVKVIITSDAAF